MVALPDLMQRTGGVDGDVGPRLVDDADHAERHPHPADLYSARLVAHVGDRADRVGQRCDFADAARHRGHRGVVERQPIDERGVEPGGARRLEVAAVGGDQGFAVGLERSGDCRQRPVALGGGRTGDSPRGGARAAAEVGDGDGGIDRVHRRGVVVDRVAGGRPGWRGVGRLARCRPGWRTITALRRVA